MGRCAGAEAPGDVSCDPREAARGNKQVSPVPPALQGAGHAHLSTPKSSLEAWEWGDWRHFSLGSCILLHEGWEKMPPQASATHSAGRGPATGCGVTREHFSSFSCCPGPPHVIMFLLVMNHTREPRTLGLGKSSRRGDGLWVARSGEAGCRGSLG